MAFASEHLSAWQAFCAGRYADAHRLSMRAAERSWETIDDSGPLAGRAAALARNVKGNDSRHRDCTPARASSAVAWTPRPTSWQACVAALDGRMA